MRWISHRRLCAFFVIAQVSERRNTPATIQPSEDHTMKKLTTRLTAMLLAGMLVIGSVPGAVFAADADAGETAEYAEEVFTEGETAEESSEAADAGAEVAEEEAAGASEGNVADTSEEAAIQYYTVTLDANGGYFENEWDDAVGEIVEQAETVTKQVPLGGTVAAVPVFVDSDGQSMIFAGWSLERDGELVITGDEEYAPVDNCTLFAVWQAEDASEGGTEDQDAAVEENNEQTDAAQGAQEVEDSAGDTVASEESAVETDTASEANTGTETENEKDIASDQDAVSANEDEENCGEESSDVIAAEEEAQSALIETSEEEETVTEEAAYGIVKSGTCGENLTWTLNDEGILTISGMGEMEDFDSDSLPFNNKRDSISTVIIELGVTSIGNNAFRECYNLTSVTIPNSVTRVGSGAFFNCTHLQSVKIPNSVRSIESSAFSDCRLANISISEGVENIGNSAFSCCNSLTTIIKVFVHMSCGYALEGTEG